MTGNVPSSGCPSAGLSGLRLLSLEKLLAQLQRSFRRHRSEQVHRTRDDAGPAGLMTRSETRSVVAMKIFVEEDQITPMGIILELSSVSVDGSSSFAVA